MRRKEQLSIVIDPFVHGGGTYVFASPHELGHTYEIDGPVATRTMRRRRLSK
jgi:hypothetical protein